ncbi:LacI family transcriptional regulator [Pseudooceanicola sp. CBS1P-1]|uniref:LacI family DNA-binding transcriptional regulator n=1 Tax=Pseudooceanicola albus TaxID=2692189 RepID=A0A6L7G347_9RHOB|nr:MULTISPECIES: LacI family DNA-binding transcriptional regulator [Pseudooceanicola]MBT9385153.1 LacI family transcriptional regulator [Pseudooceanicola endophyticus]MXN18555.1 LacI family DNA-binding transcriptional regulator [Pseudooceanicola albus]
MKKPTPPVSGAAPNMKQVAEAAGVAVSTVSRALTNPGRVNEKTRTRVAEAARKLGYTPNAAARSLRMGKSKTIMIVLPGALYYGASQIIPLALAGIDGLLARNGFKILIANLDREEATEQHIINLAGSGTVDGAIVLSSAPPSVGGRSLKDLGLPVVAMLHDISDQGVPSVITNEHQIMCAATELLIAEGHRQFLYVAGPDGVYHEVHRYAGIREAIARHGLPESALTRTEGVGAYQEGFNIGFAAAEQLLAMAPRPTAALCCSDDAALALLKRLLDEGIEVPSEVAVMGFDGAAVGALFRPALSTIEQPATEMGTRAAALLLEMLAGEEVPPVTVVDSTILRRGSA